MTKDDRIKKSYDFAADLSKQMITLSTAIITLCVAFTDKVFTSEAAQSNSSWLMWSLGIFVFSIAVGVFNLMGLTGQLGKGNVSQKRTTEQSQQQDHPEAEDETRIGNTEDAARQGDVRNVNETTTNIDDVSIYSKTNRATSLIQVLTFVIGLTLALIYLGTSISSAPADKEITEEPADTTKCIKIQRKSEFIILNGERTDTLYLLMND